MAHKHTDTGLSPTVMQVIEQFITTLREDDGIQDDAIERLETLLHEGVVPKPDRLNTALFGPSPDDES